MIFASRGIVHYSSYVEELIDTFGLKPQRRGRCFSSIQICPIEALLSNDFQVLLHLDALRIVCVERRACASGAGRRACIA
jgi:hypothetical protein